MKTARFGCANLALDLVTLRHLDDIERRTLEDDVGPFLGDVDFDAVLPIASRITPVPGGIGPLTRVMLLVNTLTAARQLEM